MVPLDPNTIRKIFSHQIQNLPTNGGGKNGYLFQK
jgi:hypothetical protein